MSQVPPNPLPAIATIPPAHREVSAKLWIGILFVPLVFSWFTLRKGHSAQQRKLAFGWLAVALVLTAANPRNATPATGASRSLHAAPSVQRQKLTPNDKHEVSSQKHGEAWPLTISAERVACRGSKGMGIAVFLDEQGKTYALNGLANSCVERPSSRCGNRQIHDITPIWRKDPNNSELRVSIGPLIDAALATCSMD